MKDKLVIFVSRNREKSHSLLKVTPEIHEKVKKLADVTGKQPIDLASTLLEWALERVEVSEEDE